MEVQGIQPGESEDSGSFFTVKSPTQGLLLLSLSGIMDFELDSFDSFGGESEEWRRIPPVASDGGVLEVVGDDPLVDAKFYFITSFDKVHLLHPNHCLKIAYASPTQAAVFLVATATSFDSFAHGEEDPFFSYYVHQPGQLHLVNHSPAGIRYS